jgi:hypothetical protein
MSPCHKLILSLEICLGFQTKIWTNGLTSLDRYKCQCCRNPSLGLTTKVKACKVAGQEGSPGVTPHAPGSVGKCEGMNPHTYKGASTLGVGVLVDFRIFREKFQGSKLNGLKNYLYYWKALRTQMFKMGLYDPFGHLQHKLWPKEGPGVKLTIWLSTTKSRESPRFPHVQVECDILLESSQRRLQLCFRPHLKWRSTHNVMGPQSCGNPNCENFGTPIWKSWYKMSFGCGPRGEAQSIL